MTQVLLFADGHGASPFLEWMDSLPVDAQHKCIIRVEQLEEFGLAVAAPESKSLTDGICQLRFVAGGTEYAILCFFYDQSAVVVHACSTRLGVAPEDVAIAVERKERFCERPERHTYSEEE